MLCMILTCEYNLKFKNYVFVYDFFSDKNLEFDWNFYRYLKPLKFIMYVFANNMNYNKENSIN